MALFQAGHRGIYIYVTTDKGVLKLSTKSVDASEEGCEPKNLVQNESCFFNNIAKRLILRNFLMCVKIEKLSEPCYFLLGGTRSALSLNGWGASRQVKV